MTSLQPTSYVGNLSVHFLWVGPETMPPSSSSRELPTRAHGKATPGPATTLRAARVMSGRVELEVDHSIMMDYDLGVYSARTI